MARGYRVGDIHPTMETKMAEEQTPCGCGRSSTGYCTGLHEMTEEEYEIARMIEDRTITTFKDFLKIKN